MIIVGYKYLLLPTLFNFSNGEEQPEMEMEGAKRKNEYAFFTLFWIPLLPLWCNKSVWEIGDELYKRKISGRGKFVNQLFGIVGIIFAILIFAGIMILLEKM